MSEGKVLSVAKIRGFKSLDRVAQALTEEHPTLFQDIAVRSLGAKLSELNRANVLWWSRRPERLEALQSLLEIDLADLLTTDEARRRGRWVCDEFPELPALDLLTERPPTLAEPVSMTVGDTARGNMDTWLRVGLGSDYEQPPLQRLGTGIQWLHAPSGTGRRLLLARIQARNRLDVFEGKTLAEIVMKVSASRAAVLAPTDETSLSGLSALAQLRDAQPVLVVSAHPLPRPAENVLAQTHIFPSWEWLMAPPAERARSEFAAEGADRHAGIYGREPIVEFKWQLVPTWRSTLLQWVEERLFKQSDTLFSAAGFTKWLGAFDPDEVFFHNPAAVLSLTRLCHEIGERRLPLPKAQDAGTKLVKLLGRADSRYLSLLARLVSCRWLDASTAWNLARPWDDWLSTHQLAPIASGGKKSMKERRRVAVAPVADPASVQLTQVDLDVATKAKLLIPNGDGDYGFRSVAEASLLLRDQIRAWMEMPDLSKWGAQIIGDNERQALIDATLDTIKDEVLLDLCRLAAKLPLWSAVGLGASEALFLAVGKRMANGTLSYRAELGELLSITLNRCESDDLGIELPLSRALTSDIARLDWIRAAWGWSLVAPKPRRVPQSIVDQFPGWAGDDVDWLRHLPVPEDLVTSPLHLSRLTAAINTAVSAANIRPLSIVQSSASPVLIALVGMWQAVKHNGNMQISWWRAIEARSWAPDVMAALLSEIQPELKQRLAMCLLEALGDQSVDEVSVIFLMRSRVWLRLLDSDNAKLLCEGLTSAALVFVARHIQSFPPTLRRVVADTIDPAILPLDFDWETLLGTTDVPSQERLEQLLDDLRLWRVSVALWSLFPSACLGWAANPNHPHRDLFLEQCPPRWLPHMTTALAREPIRKAELRGRRAWAMQSIIHAAPHAEPLLELLSGSVPSSAPT